MQGKVHALLVSLHFYAVVLINYIVQVMPVRQSPPPVLV